MSSKLPGDWPRISPSLYYQDAGAAIDWICRAFGFQIRIKVEGENGTIEHSELLLGTGVVMVSGERAPIRKSPRSVGAVNTQGLFAYVEDVEAHCARARAAGANILVEPTTTDYGADYWTDRSYEVEDCEGHRWGFAERIRDVGK